MRSSQPFNTQQIARDSFFTDREAEVARVVEAMRTRDRLVLYGERRMGKSSVIARAAERIRDDGGVVLAADAWTMDGLDDLNRSLMESVPTTWLVGDRLSRLLDALRSMVSVSADDKGRPVVQFSGQSSAPDTRAAERLGRILHGLDELAADNGAPVVVVIDEFQRLEEVQAGSGGLLRRIVQETPHLAYVFSGSIVGLVMDLVGPKGPFHAVERLEIRGIDREHLVPWIEHRLENHGVEVTEASARAIYDRAGPVTEYVMRLAKVVYRRGRGGSVSPKHVEAAFDEIVADYAGSFELIWDGLSVVKRQILRAVADGEQKLNSKAVLDAYDINTSSAATYGINELRGDGLLAPGKPYRVSDPFLADWVRRRT